MKYKKHMKLLTSLILCFTMCTSSIIVRASDISNKPITMEDINSSETKTIYTSEETVYWPDSKQLSTKASGEYPIYTRVKTTQSSSNGTIQQSSKTGLFASIASTVLSFKLTGVAGMTVSAILSAVGVAASEEQYVQTRTFISYIDYEKHGQARWSNESTYSTWVVSGKRNYFKHVQGGTQNSSGNWELYVKNYTSSPAKTLTGVYYNNADSWFKDQSYQRIQTGQILFDTPY